MTSEAELYEKIKVAQAAAVEQVRIRHGKSHADVAAVLNAPPKAAEPDGLADRWRRSGEGQMRALGMSPVTDEEAIKIRMQVEQRVGEKTEQRARAAADALSNFRREVEVGRVTPGSRFYVDPLNQTEVVMDARTGKPMSWNRNVKIQEMIDAAETALIYETLKAGDPAPRKTPAEIAQERFDAEHKS